VPLVDQYLQLQVGFFALDLDFLVPGIVTDLNPESGLVTIRFDDRSNDYGPATVGKLLPRPEDFFPALVLYDPQRLRQVAAEDATEFVKMALRSNREGRLGYKDLKGTITELLGEKGWKGWWQTAKRDLKRDPRIGMSAGSQPSFRMLRQADRYEDRLRREFDFQKDPLEKLLKVMTYLDEVAREEKQSACEDCADEALLSHFGNGAAKIAVAVLKDSPSLALAGLALHAEVAARGVAVAKPNPKAGAAVVARIADAGELVTALPESLLQRVMAYIRRTMPERWGEVWAIVLLRAGKRLCDTITKGLIEGDQKLALENALLQAVQKPTSSPDLLGWLWRTRHSSTSASQFLAGLDSLPVPVIGYAMFSLLDSQGKLYGMSMEERHLKNLESARAALATQSTKPLIAWLDTADRAEAIRLKAIIEKNHGLAPAMRTQLLGYLRSRFADIFFEVTREWEDPTTVYTTEDGLRHTEQALQHIKDVEIPAVAKQIGEAASFGDLSENAEYTAALEKRDQLFSRANTIEADLNRAVIITAEMAHSDFVNAGTRVTARSLDSGAEEVYTFLGPWDTDVENKVLNYQAPLSLAFMGARTGDQVQFGEEGEMRSWEILKIEPAV
jgi:transcription elongation factor GreA